MIAWEEDRIYQDLSTMRKVDYFIVYPTNKSYGHFFSSMYPFLNPHWKKTKKTILSTF